MLRDLEWELEYRTGENEPVNSFYRPALSTSNTYYRGVGYFSSSSFEEIGQAMEQFFAQDGYMRLITSVHLSEEDKAAIEMGMDQREIIEQHLHAQLEEDFLEPLKPGCKMLAEMLAKKKLDIKIATTNSGGLYHEKVGVIIDSEDDFVAFSGSQNESKHSFSDTYESIDVFTSWDDTKRAKNKFNHFEALWNGEKTVRVYDLPDGIKKIIIKRARTPSKTNPSPTVPAPSPTPEDEVDVTSREPTVSEGSSRYAYQEEAVDWFLNTSTNSGIYWMATGTGKTVTAMKTIVKMFDEDLIDAVVLCASDRLLRQWKGEFGKPLPDGRPANEWLKYSFEHTADAKQSARFRQTARKAGRILYTTYSFLPEISQAFLAMGFDGSRTLLLVDELHNIGSHTIQRESTKNLPDGYATSFDVFGHRLGLSATPLSDFDDTRNRFILSSFADPHQDYTEREDWNESTLEEQRQIRISSLDESNAVFFFGLEAAIKRDVLVEFDYTAWRYAPSPEEYEERQNVRRYWKKKISDGEAPPGHDAIMAAKIFKKSPSKLLVFRDKLEGMSPEDREELFTRCLIFVADTAFGREVSRIISDYGVHFHEYFSEDDPEILATYRETNYLETLITCHMISEGIDIRSVKNIILFSSDRQRLETVQRIGRALRKDPTDIEKRAHVYDFVNLEPIEPDQHLPADWERYYWLSKLTETRGEWDE